VNLRPRIFQFARILTLVLSGLALLPAWAAAPDEGMWTFDNPPTKLLQEKYGFTPTQEWFDNIRLASVRFNDGGSGSFVSPHGLTLTNHHVALGQLQKISTPQKNYVKDGFLARTQAEELKCPDLELNVLMSMENVTARVQAAAKPGMSEADAFAAHKAEIAKIERESLDATGLRSDVITLYNGGEYWLYRYKKYTDIRLVFAPEQQAAFFGGDPDNFTYPRYDLDMALFRVYENGKPIETPHYLKWNPRGASDGELVFVSGNPGFTERQTTMAGIDFERDVVLPAEQKLLQAGLDAARKYSALGPEQAREASAYIFFAENEVKRSTGELQGLRDKDVMDGLQKRESDFRALVNSKPEWKQDYASAWDQLVEAAKIYAPRFPEDFFTRFRQSMPRNALTIVQYVAEIKKPDGQRLEGFHDSELASLKFRLLSPAPVYPKFEATMFATQLQLALNEVGPQNAWVATVLNGRSPEEVAHELIMGSKIGDPAFRKSLLDGGQAAVDASTDPLIVMARKLDPIVRARIKWDEDNVDSVETSAGQKIGEARFAVYGKSTYPDATFTLRLSYGTVKGYPMNGTLAPPITTYYGLYDRSYSFGGKPPFNLPERYAQRRDTLDLATPLDFVSTCDIVGGNSGSPVINRKGEIVGLIFDGNIESLISDYTYDDTKSRAVAVETSAMTLALRKLYDAGFIADELEGK
jgi:hypothetical protein